MQEDMITFANSLTGINYACKTDEELMVATVEPVDTLSYKDLCQNGILPCLLKSSNVYRIAPTSLCCIRIIRCASYCTASTNL